MTRFHWVCFMFLDCTKTMLSLGAKNACSFRVLLHLKILVYIILNKIVVQSYS